MPTRKYIVSILIAFVASVSTVALIAAYASRIRTSGGAFVRILPPHAVIEGDSLNITYNSYYIAGATTSTIYLGNSTAPLHLMVLNTNLTDTQHVRLDFPDANVLKFWSPKVAVDSPNFYFYDGAVPAVYSGLVTDWKAKRLRYDSVFFRSITPIDTTQYFINSISSSTNENTIGIMNVDTRSVNFNPAILKKQVDGLFCTDGSLLYSPAVGAVYVYYYRNQFTIIDTTLQHTYVGHTIDTISKARIKVSKLDSGRTYVLSSPPFFVNKKSSVVGSLLFVNSNLLARNEQPDVFEQAEPIDVYDLNQHGKYLFSFYIYNYTVSKRMKDFKVVPGLVVVLYDRMVRVFQWNNRVFDQYSTITDMKDP
jgi:hypothetical protein